ncbi:MAG: cytochrome c family protein [Rhodoferax sp.]
MKARGRLLASLLAFGVAAAVQAAPDAVHGEQVYVRCLACHALAYDRVGPHHCGLFGRLAGSVPGFAYSPAMTKSRIVWNEKTLDQFLKSPMKMVPGTAMTYDGVPDPKDRADLIAYLKQVNTTVACHK